MIVIVIIGLLATVSTPIYQDIPLEGKKSSLRANLISLREAITHYNLHSVTSTGAESYSDLNDLTFTNDVVISGIPANPFQPEANAPDSIVEGFVVGQIVGTRGGWAYKPGTGEIWPNTSSTVPASGCSGTHPLNENMW